MSDLTRRQFLGATAMGTVLLNAQLGATSFQAATDEGWPAMDDESLLARLEEWLLPALSGMTRLEQLKKLNLSDLLRQSLPWPLPKRLDEALPSHFNAPTGSRVRIRYQPGQAPVIPTSPPTPVQSCGVWRSRRMRYFWRRTWTASILLTPIWIPRL